MEISYNFFISNIMTSKAQVRCNVTETTLLYQTFVCFWQFTMIFGHNMGQNPYRSIVLAKI